MLSRRLRCKGHSVTPRIAIRPPEAQLSLCGYLRFSYNSLKLDDLLIEEGGKLLRRSSYNDGSGSRDLLLRPRHAQDSRHLSIEFSDDILRRCSRDRHRRPRGIVIAFQTCLIECRQVWKLGHALDAGYRKAAQHARLQIG